MAYEFKMQPVVIAADGCARFAQNRIVRRLLVTAQKNGYDQNDIAIDVAEGKFEQAEVEQLTQLIGYSVSGFCDLSTSSARHKAAAKRAVQKLISEEDPTNA
jgi:hypothetical protein